MACIKKTRGDCVEIIGGFCEVGEGCFEGCEYAFTPERSAEASAAFEEAYPI